MNSLRTIAATLLAALALEMALPADTSAQMQATLVATGLDKPVALVQDPSDSTVQVIVEQFGHVRVLKNGDLQPDDFLDLSGVVWGEETRGLLGLAFAPDYASTGRLFVNFIDQAGNTVIARFTRSLDDPLRADPDSRFDLVWPDGNAFIQQVQGDHNGGQLAFGPDGYLYIGLGDGGCCEDPNHYAQDPASLLGKMLRIDVSVADDDAEGYDVPGDNPFVDEEGVFSEIWAFGLRNPWRWSFDAATGALFIADVGQDEWEEIDYQPAGVGGRNYGWRNREGAHDHITDLPPYSELVDPIYEYGRDQGRSVIGGVVYRGSALPGLYGRYLFADFVFGSLWSMGIAVDPETHEAGVIDVADHTDTPGFLSGRLWVSFGVDAAGEVYLLSYTGKIYRLDAIPPDTTPPSITTAPESQTVVVNHEATLTVGAVGAPTLQYQWYQGPSGDTSLPIDGATDSTFTTPLLLETTTYWSRVTNPFGSADSSSATITINIVTNGSFTDGSADWQSFGTPDESSLVSHVVTPLLARSISGGTLVFYRKPTASETDVSGMYQETGRPFPADTALRATLALGNSSLVRKRISVVLADFDFSDLAICTFWLQPSTPLRPYEIRTHTTTSWSNASIYLYAETAGQGGGFYLADNVSVTADPQGSVLRTDCVDQTSPLPTADPDGPDLMTNGGFESGLDAWTATGLTSELNGGLLQFVRATSAPGLISQVLESESMPAHEIVAATLQLGNTSTARKRVTVRLHDVEESDLILCSFWLQPGQALSDYVVRGFTTKAWDQTVLSIASESVDVSPWIQLDTVTLQRTPGAEIVGTECVETGVALQSAHAPSVLPLAGSGPAVVVQTASAPATPGVPDASVPQSSGDAVLELEVGPPLLPASEELSIGETETTFEVRPPAGGSAIVHWRTVLNLRDVAIATLRFFSYLSVQDSHAEVQISTDDTTWSTIAWLEPTYAWQPVRLNLRDFIGQTVTVRFLYVGHAWEDSAPAGGWTVSDLTLETRTIVRLRSNGAAGSAPPRF